MRRALGILAVIGAASAFVILSTGASSNGVATRSRDLPERVLARPARRQDRGRQGRQDRLARRDPAAAGGGDIHDHAAGFGDFRADAECTIRRSR